MTTRELQTLDQRVLWHPFTQMRDWCAPDHEPLVLARGKGAWLWDSEGRQYLDGNSSIWTNIHGHAHPVLDAALREQLGKVAHTSFLGFTNEPAIRLASELTALFPPRTLTRVFYSDDGSTAIECALKMAIQYHQLVGRPERREFAAFDLAYHGDTMGAATLGGIATFHERFGGLGLPVRHFASMEALESLPPAAAERLAAVVIEPLIQGAAGMRLWPAGLLRRLRQWADAHGVLVIFDEVMTGFGRTGRMFACEHEGVLPDFLCLAKGLTGGYLPLAATLTTERVFDAFLGRYDELKTFFHGHSYCGNPLACAAALASLRLFREEGTLEALRPKVALLGELFAGLQAKFPRHVSGARQCGFIAACDVWQDATSATPFDWREQTGASICLAARKHGLLTRPVRDTLVLMPPLCTTADELRHAARALEAAMTEVFAARR